MVKEVTGLHVAVKHFGAQAGVPSVSTQIAVLRRLLLASVSSANLDTDGTLGWATGAGIGTSAFADVASVSLAAFHSSRLLVFPSTVGASPCYRIKGKQRWKQAN